MASDQSSARFPWVALALSFLSSGVGHIYCGRIVKGLFLYSARFLLPLLCITAAFSQPSNGVLLGLILALAAGLRFYGLAWGTDWQTGTFHAFHPDEKTLVDSAPLVGVNLREIVASYGKAPMYALAGAARLLGVDLDILSNEAGHA